MKATALAGAAVVLALLAGCSSDGASTGTSGGGEKVVQVQIMKDSGVGHYHPYSVDVAVGGKVVWTNRSGVVHNVVFEDKFIESSSLFTDGETFETEFERAGVYEYYCTLHPTMRGEVRAN